MRTTLTIDDEVLAAARSLADMGGRSVGSVLSELARQGLQGKARQTSERNGFPIFQQKSPAMIMTPEKVKDALEDG